MSTNNLVKWRCTRYGVCSRADGHAEVLLARGAPFTCPGCGEGEGILMAPPQPFPLKPVLIGFASFVVVGLGLAMWNLKKPGPKPVEKRPTTTPAAVNPISVG